VSGHLLDVNVLIALLDPSHEHHERAHAWFAAEGSAEWFSCPTTQNGTVRIVSHPRYSNSQPVPVVLDSLDSLVAAGNHRFVADSASLLDEARIDRDGLLSGAQVTDTYLLALAVSLGAHLATFDRKLVATGVHGGAKSVFQIP
jgi:toxin-antitoxin system PIN domain toxin